MGNFQHENPQGRGRRTGTDHQNCRSVLRLLNSQPLVDSPDPIAAEPELRSQNLIILSQLARQQRQHDCKPQIRRVLYAYCRHHQGRLFSSRERQRNLEDH